MDLDAFYLGKITEILEFQAKKKNLRDTLLGQKHSIFDYSVCGNKLKGITNVTKFVGHVFLMIYTQLSRFSLVILKYFSF